MREKARGKLRGARAGQLHMRQRGLCIVVARGARRKKRTARGGCSLVLVARADAGAGAGVLAALGALVAHLACVGGAREGQWAGKGQGGRGVGGMRVAWALAGRRRGGSVESA